MGDVLLRAANNGRCAIYAPLILAQSACDWRLCSSARFAARVLVCVCVRARVCVCVRPLRAAVVEQAVVLRLKAGESEWTVVASRLLQHASLQHATLQAPQQHQQ